METTEQSYLIQEGLQQVEEGAKAKFDESVEVHIRLNLKSKKEDVTVRGVCVLPHGTGKSKRVAVFTEREDKQTQAKEAGAEVVGGKELIMKIKSTEKIDFGVALATPDIMKDLAPIAKVLGPRGLMPSPKTETIVEDMAKAVKELKAGKVEFKADKSGNVHQVIGKISFGQEKLKDNFSTFIDALRKVLPDKMKGELARNIFVCSTMGKSVRIHL